jgi:hypothetical protein
MNREVQIPYLKVQIRDYLSGAPDGAMKEQAEEEL